jgi:adenylate kinase
MTQQTQKTQNTTTILLIGRPGSGKGTQAKLLSEKLGWVRVSSGERIKAIRDGNEPFSARVREVYDKGSLLPDWFADYILEDSLLGLASHVGIIMEGFARTRNQAEHLTDIIDWLGRSLIVLNLEVSEDEVARRMHSRSVIENRPDSNTEEKIRERLRQYDALTAPGLAYFREQGNVIDIDGEETPEQIAEAIVQALNRS